MATWHQRRNPVDLTKGKGWILVSDAHNEPAGRMMFGENEEMARESLKNHRKNQPNLHHYLYYNGELKG